jgi:quinol monooxygenase YgiN
MIGVIARLRVHAGKGAEFETFFKALAAKVASDEPGNKLYQLCKSRSDPDEYVVMEIYADQAAVEAHRNSPHFQAARPGFGQLLQPGPMNLEILDTVD